MRPLMKQIADEVAKVLKEKFLGTAAADDTLHDLAKASAASVAEDDVLRRVLEAVSDELGTTNPDRLAAACLEALSPLPHAEVVELTKALAGQPVNRRPFANVPGELEAEFQDRAAQLALKKAAGQGAPGDDTDSRFYREAADVLPILRNMKPMSFDRPTRPDRRAALRELAAEARRAGNTGGAAMHEHELVVEEVRHATATPSATLAVRATSQEVAVP